jgi:hypothetical protein
MVETSAADAKIAGYVRDRDAKTRRLTADLWGKTVDCLVERFRRRWIAASEEFMPKVPHLYREMGGYLIACSQVSNPPKGLIPLFWV